jgi:branched-chain amino acid transport system substrate-binding protein
MTWDMVHALALAIEAANAADTAAINAKIREVSNPAGQQVYTYAEAKEALKKGKINFEGASSVLDFDQYGDVTPDFGVFFIEAGKLNRRYVVKL